MQTHNDVFWIDRSLSEGLRAAWRDFPAVVLTGARQTGKTSLCRRLLPAANYVTLDIPAEAETARLAPERFLDNHTPPLIIDEIQYAPDLLRHLKIRIDADRQPGRYLLTGSQDFLLMQGVSESLAGRCAVLSLMPLSLPEVSRAGLANEATADDFFWRGGWPALWQRPGMERDLWLGSYLATYLERDVRNTVNVASLRDFNRFLRASALRAGQMLSMAEIARDIGVAPNTAKKWISILQSSHQILLLEPWHANAGKRLVKTPKLYFLDSGLLLYLLGFRSWQDVQANPAWGAIWENIVVSEFLKLIVNSASRHRLYFWRTSVGEEVDLVIETGARSFIAIECKTAERVTGGDLRGIGAMTRAYGADAVQTACCVCRTTRSYPVLSGGKVMALSLADALNECRKALGFS
jgi:predicted AAA+ superfamily ATPase